MWHLTWLGELAAIAGGSWLGGRLEIVRFGEDAEGVAQLLQRERLTQTRATQSGEAPTSTPGRA